MLEKLIMEKKKKNPVITRIQHTFGVTITSSWYQATIVLYCQIILIDT